MEFENILWEKKDGVGILTLNRPESRNALQKGLRADVVAGMEQFEADPEVRVVILTGTGKAFCAGGDIKHMVDSSMWEIILDRTREKLFNYIENFPKPVIAAIQGLALGGGCELAMACDFRVCSENARFGQPEINLGIFPGGGATQRMQRLIGVGRAKEMIFTGDIIDAREAERIGLVNKIFPAGELMKGAVEIAVKMAGKSPLALRISKDAINMGMQTGLQVGLAYEKLARTLVHGSEDRVEGMRAFLEKRKPSFKGK